jgi:hypothetical protein
LIWNPLRGIVTLTLTYVLIAYLLVDGIVTIILAINHRQELSGRWEWMLVNGIVDFILAGIIFAALPEAFTWALGVIIGIDLIFGGTAMIGIAVAARHPNEVSFAVLIAARAITGWPCQPRIEPTARDTERPAHPFRRPCPPVLRD